MATPTRSQYAGPATRFSTLREASTIFVAIVAICVVFLAFSSCVSSSREGLPPGSPFTDQVELEKPSLPDGTAVGDITTHSAELWLKTQGPKRIQVEWASVEAWKRISAMASVQSPAARTPPVLTGPETDFTLTVSFEHPRRAFDTATPSSRRIRINGSGHPDRMLPRRANSRPCRILTLLRRSRSLGAGI